MYIKYKIHLLRIKNMILIINNLNIIFKGFYEKEESTLCLFIEINITFWQKKTIDFVWIQLCKSDFLFQNYLHLLILIFSPLYKKKNIYFKKLEQTNIIFFKVDADFFFLFLNCHKWTQYFLMWFFFKK